MQMNDNSIIDDELTKDEKGLKSGIDTYNHIVDWWGVRVGGFARISFFISINLIFAS